MRNCCCWYDAVALTPIHQHTTNSQAHKGGMEVAASSSATPNGPAAATTDCCLVCLEPAPAIPADASPVLACADGHRICTRNGCLDRLALLQLSDPTRLRTAAAAGGRLPCPDPGCPRGWAYAELHPLLSPQAQQGAVEGLLSFVVRATQQPPTQASSEQEQESEAALAQRVREEVLNLRCPGCRTVFLDFDACCAVTCGACGLVFCGLCLVPAAAAAAAAMPVAAAGAQQQNEAAHAHAVGVHGALFFSEERVRRLQNRFRTQRLVDFLLPNSPTTEDEEDQGLARALRVLAAVAPDCAALGLDVSRVEAALHRRARGLPAAAAAAADHDDEDELTVAGTTPYIYTYHRHPSGRDLPGDPISLVVAPGAAPPRRGPRVFFASPSSTPAATPATTIDNENDGDTTALLRRRPGRLELEHLRGEEGRLRAAARFRKLPREASPIARLAPLPAPAGGRGGRGEGGTEGDEEDEEETDGEEGMGDRRRWKRRCAARPRSFSFSSHGVVEREESDWSVTSSVCGGIPLAGLGLEIHRARAGSSGSEGGGPAALVLHTGRSSLPPLSGGSQWAEGSGVTWEGGESTPSFFSSSDEEGCYGGWKTGPVAEEDEKEGVELAMDVGDGEAAQQPRPAAGGHVLVQGKDGGGAAAPTNANAGKRVLRFSF